MQDLEHEFRRLKTLAEEAAAQLDDDGFIPTLGDGDNSIPVLMKHIGGNLRSRWTDFLTTDGEKPDRHRDREFHIGDAESHDDIRKIWELGWAALFEALGSLRPDDWERTVFIRREPHTVRQASYRSLGHIAYHVGQIVLLAKHHAGESWRTLSIPRGETEKYNAQLGAHTSGQAENGGTL